MKYNQRGEIATLTVIAIAGVALLLGTIAPSLNPFNRIFGGGQTAANAKASWTRQTETREPILLQKGGSVAVGTKETLVYDTGMTDVPVKLTFGQKIGNFFSNLATGSIIFIIVSLVFFGGTPIIWIWRKYVVMKQAMKTTVDAIREVDDDTAAKLKPILSKKMDKRDKRVVDKLKMELN